MANRKRITRKVAAWDEREARASWIRKQLGYTKTDIINQRMNIEMRALTLA